MPALRGFSFARRYVMKTRQGKNRSAAGPRAAETVRAGSKNNVQGQDLHDSASNDPGVRRSGGGVAGRQRPVRYQRGSVSRRSPVSRLGFLGKSFIRGT